jgi:hypothetical protein
MRGQQPAHPRRRVDVGHILHGDGALKLDERLRRAG